MAHRAVMDIAIGFKASRSRHALPGLGRPRLATGLGPGKRGAACGHAACAAFTLC